MSVVFPAAGFGQENEDDQQPLMLQEDIDDYLQQTRQLVNFMEFAFNTLGNPEVSPREKDIIINQSYLKFFGSKNVQIEDDLVEGRFTVTNKDVQAYLKDIDFFFKDVTFTFNIEDISYNVNDKGQVFFVVTSNRILSGVTAEQDTIFNNQLRFIEINLDRDKRDLKIASIYTRKLSEKEDMRNWWAGLDADWRLFFAKGTMILDEYPLKDILGFDDDWILIERFQVTIIDDYIMESRRADTIYTQARQIYQEIGKYWRSETVDLSDFPHITDIDPLSKLTKLSSINISRTHVDDLTPIRNLTRLENLNISNTLVTSLEPLRFSVNLKYLDAGHTPLSELQPLLAFPALERLNLTGTSITGLEPLAGLRSLRDLRLANTDITSLTPLGRNPNLIVLDISGSGVEDLEPLSQMHSLERLHADNTALTDLSPLSGLSGLQYLFIESTEVSDIQSVSGLASLKRIYCDRTLITREKANAFMHDNPEVLVIYESQALTAWWSAIPGAWKDVFRKMAELSEPPSREELHEVANITHIDIGRNKNIYNLLPLKQLHSLQSLLAPETNISAIDALKENLDIVELDLSSTFVHDISALSSLRILEKLNLNNSPVENIESLKSARQLRYLNIESTNISSLLPLAELNNLELVLCDGISADQDEVGQIYDANPKVTVVYQTVVLDQWWQTLPEAWIHVLSQHQATDIPPTRLQLQRIVDIREIDISNTPGLSSLLPLFPFHRIQILKMNNTQISDLDPLKHHKTITELFCADNPIRDLAPLKNLDHLTVLNCSNTLVSNLKELGKPDSLQILNVAGTQIRNLRALRDMHSLRQLDCYNTRIRSLRPIENLKNLELLRCYNTQLWPWSINRFMKAVPDCEVVYY